jgi:hypothetical protein
MITIFISCNLNCIPEMVSSCAAKNYVYRCFVRGLTDFTGGAAYYSHFLQDSPLREQPCEKLYSWRSLVLPYELAPSIRGSFSLFWVPCRSARCPDHRSSLAADSGVCHFPLSAWVDLGFASLDWVVQLPVDRRVTRWCCRPPWLACSTVSSWLLQWLNSWGNLSAIVFPFPRIMPERRCTSIN